MVKTKRGSDGLSLTQLYMVAFLIGVLTVFFDVAYQSFLPSLVECDQLVSANSKLELGTALASVIGPGLAGTLVQLVSGPFALLVDAISFVVSAASIAGIRVQTVHPATLTTTHKLLPEISEGLRFVWQHPIIRVLTLSAALFNLFDSMMGAEYILYLSQKLHMEAIIIGLIGAFGGGGWLLGAVVTSTSLRQALVPPARRRRVAAVVRVVSWGVGSFGALLGGILAEWSDLRTTMVVGAVSTLVTFIWLVLSPVRRVQSL